ncbi:hypothetical protein EC968_010167 [Mortierella alpina]|nr:hypothetical protein EC968_010167 [Mortierella alpina]
MASNLNGDRLIYFTAGVSLVFMMYSVVRHATALFDSEPPESRNILGMVEDKISMDALAQLARSDSIVLQGSSVRILLNRVMREHNLRFILDTIADSDNEEERWKGVTTLQLLTRNDALHPELIRADLIRTLAEMSRLSFGNANMPKVCLQALVRLISTMDDDDDAQWYLTELLDYDIVLLIATYIRSDDFELVYWAIGLMHEFAVKGVALEQFKAVNGLCRSLNVLLAADESYISRVVLRTLKYMMLQDPIFQLQALNAGIGQRIPKCLISKDDDVKYWTLSLTHEFVRLPSWRKQFIESGALILIINLGVSSVARRPLKPEHEVLPAEELIMDIVVMTWGSKNDLETLVQTHGVLEATCIFLQMEARMGDLAQNRLAVVMAEIANYNEAVDRRLTRYGVNLNLGLDTSTAE